MSGLSRAMYVDITDKFMFLKLVKGGSTGILFLSTNLAVSFGLGNFLWQQFLLISSHTHIFKYVVLVVCLS